MNSRTRCARSSNAIIPTPSPWLCGADPPDQVPLVDRSPIGESTHAGGASWIGGPHGIAERNPQDRRALRKNRQEISRRSAWSLRCRYRGAPCHGGVGDEEDR